MVLQGAAPDTPEYRTFAEPHSVHRVDPEPSIYAAMPKAMQKKKTAIGMDVNLNPSHPVRESGSPFLPNSSENGKHGKLQSHNHHHQSHKQTKHDLIDDLIDKKHDLIDKKVAHKPHSNDKHGMCHKIDVSNPVFVCPDGFKAHPTGYCMRWSTVPADLTCPPNFVPDSFVGDFDRQSDFDEDHKKKKNKQKKEKGKKEKEKKDPADGLKKLFQFEECVHYSHSFRYPSCPDPASVMVGSECVTETRHKVKWLCPAAMKLTHNPKRCRRKRRQSGWT
eukprot:Selendium_serpulae@DN5858_c0_g2_i1.p1